MHQFLRPILMVVLLGQAPAMAQQSDRNSPRLPPRGTNAQPQTPETAVAETVKLKSQKEKQALAEACLASQGAAEGCRQFGR